MCPPGLGCRDPQQLAGEAECRVCRGGSPALLGRRGPWPMGLSWGSSQAVAQRPSAFPFGRASPMGRDCKSARAGSPLRPLLPPFHGLALACPP